MDPSPIKSIWIVIAAYNEESRLGQTLAQLLPLYEKVVVVDDCSADRTAEIARRGGAWLLQHSINLGQGAALQTGIDFALSKGATHIVTFDADGQHNPLEIKCLLRPLESEDVQVALGSRFLGKTEAMPWSRRLVLKAGVVFTRFFSHIEVTDTHNGLRAMTRKAAQKIRMTQNRMAHASEFLDLLSELQIPFCEVPVTIRYSQETLGKGQSSLNAFHILAKMLLRRVTP